MIVNQTPVLVPVHVYIAVLEHNWVIILHKQRFPAVLAVMIVLVCLYLSTLPHMIYTMYSGRQKEMWLFLLYML